MVIIRCRKNEQFSASSSFELDNAQILFSEHCSIIFIMFYEGIFMVLACFTKYSKSRKITYQWQVVFLYNIDELKTIAVFKHLQWHTHYFNAKKCFQH